MDCCHKICKLPMVYSLPAPIAGQCTATVLTKHQQVRTVIVSHVRIAYEQCNKLLKQWVTNKKFWDVVALMGALMFTLQKHEKLMMFFLEISQPKVQQSENSFSVGWSLRFEEISLCQTQSESRWCSEKEVLYNTYLKKKKKQKLH